jgi:hypothetical protein
MSARSGIFAAWANAWLDGAVGADDVLAAITADDAPHTVVGPDGTDGLLGDALLLLRRDGGPVRLVLPVPGDVRGLPGPAGFRDAALEAGEAVCASACAFVPEIVDHYPSSAPDTVCWRYYAVDPPPPDPLAVTDAQQDLAVVIRDSATALAAADVAGTGSSSDDLSVALGRARRAGEFLDLPPSHPPRAVALLAQAERLQAVLDLAVADPLGGAVDRFGAAARDATLRPLATAVRRARLAGYNAGAHRP